MNKFLRNWESNVNLNSYGHRCKELSELNLHNYILFVGDNICLSYHLPIEETFPYIVSKKLNVDYYNLSIFNGGIEAIKFNLLSWVHIISQPPKAIVFASEFANAILVSDSTLTYVKPADYNNEDVMTLMNVANDVGFHSSRRAMFSHIIKQFNYPMYQITLADKEKTIESENVIELLFNGDAYDQLGISDLIVNTLQIRSNKIRP
jgi:hypothetical protein